MGLYYKYIFKHTPFSSSVSKVYGIAETFYFPGILKHQGIRIYSGYQYMKNGNYSYGNVISLARGYTGINLEETFQH